MEISDIFFNQAGRLRSGWRLAIFTAAYWIVLLVAWNIVSLAASIIGAPAINFLNGRGGWVFQAILLFSSAAFVGWVCARVLEDLPWRALGWALHAGCLRDLLLGSLFGSLSLIFAAALITVFGGYRFTFAARTALPSVFKTLIISCIIFIIAAAAEEMIFRGYPLQTTTRARLAWLGLMLTSLAFAFVHLGNPNVVPGFTFFNTALAGVWLAVAYLRTRSLWFPLGVHWSWNWTMAALLGIPVSGIEQLTPAPLMRAANAGPDWLTGGSYGIEGGLACTVTLILSSIVVRRTRLLSATPEMKELTDHEKPKENMPLRITM